jgi:putative heme-binding domain-containing protein
MRRALFATLSLSLLTFAGVGWSADNQPPDPLAEHIAPSDPLSPADEVRKFHLPPGFVAELVAAEPDIGKPMNIAFDDKGRLWVTESREYPFPAGANVKPRDAVKVLEDFGPDGRARKITTFADGLNIPIGVLPLSNSTLVYSIPNIWRLTDTDGDGKADKREVLYGTIGFRDTHGMTNNFNIGFDGWIYACHGYSNTSKVEGTDKAPITMQSGNVYRMKADGSHVEYFTHGQVNPFGLAFDSLGNLFSCDCHTKPIMLLLHGGYYDSFGKPHDGLGYAPDMIDQYPDSTAIAGIAYYAADNYPVLHRESAYIGDVVTNCVNEFRLNWTGSTPFAVKHEFLRSDDRWFRPVSVQLGPDGALYVADFYNRIIGHYEVPLDHPGRDRERGRIWRIVYRGPDGKGKALSPCADFGQASVSELVALLAHPNLTVRLKATNQLVERPGQEVNEAVLKVMKPGWPTQQMHGLWVLERRGVLDDKLLSTAAADPERGLRVHVQRILAERKELNDAQRELALAALKDSDALVQRCAAVTLGRHPRPDNLQPLLALVHAVPPADTHLLYAARRALCDTLQPATAWKNVAPKGLDPADSAAIASVALAVPSPEAAGFLLGYLGSQPPTTDPSREAVHHIARYGEGATDQLLTLVIARTAASLDSAVASFHAIEQGTQERGAKLSDVAHQWAVDLDRKLLDSSKPEQVLAGIVLAGTQRLESHQDKLAALAADPKAPENQRNAALTSLAAIDSRKHSALFGRILADANEPFAIREQAVKTLAPLNQAEAQAELLNVLPTAPARLQSIIAVGLASSQSGAEKLLEAVAAGKASARLLQERPVEVRLTQANVPNLKERVAKLTQGLPSTDQRVQELMTSRHRGFQAAKTDAEAGAQIFEKHCAICHQLAGKGAKIGPQLDGIGNRGLDRLLEDVLDPNRNVDQAFRLTTLTLTNGTLVSGLLLKEEGEVLVLADDKGKEVRVPKNKVEERNTAQLSPMPANFVDQVPESDFYNLMAFLLKQQPERK